MEIETVSAAGAGSMDAVYSQEISALPEAVLIHVASFLHQIPLALFCVAMTAESSAWRKADWNLPLSLASQKILSSREGMWDILDFSELDHSLRWKLTDDDLGALLAVIDGRNKLKKLFLTRPEPWKSGCINVKGYGLEPLRGSDVMVQIDIDYPNISEDVALPIIESFIHSRQSSLRHISLPEHWRKNKSSNLVSFLSRYDDFLYRLRFGCQQCGARVGRSRHNDHRIECIDDRGLQEITCYKCLSQFCTCCKSYDGEPVDPSFAIRARDFTALAAAVETKFVNIAED